MWRVQFAAIFVCLSLAQTGLQSRKKIIFNFFFFTTGALLAAMPATRGQQPLTS